MKGVIKIENPVNYKTVIEYDLIAPEGYAYKSKLDGCIHGDKIVFRTLNWLLGKKLSQPITESIEDFELVDERLWIGSENYDPDYKVDK